MRCLSPQILSAHLRRVLHPVCVRMAAHALATSPPVTGYGACSLTMTMHIRLVACLLLSGAEPCEEATPCAGEPCEEATPWLDMLRNSKPASAASFIRSVAASSSV